MNTPSYHMRHRIYYMYNYTQICCCLMTMRSRVQVLEIASYINASKHYIHKTQSGQTLPRTGASGSLIITLLPPPPLERQLVPKWTSHG
jgi:hypothetical protein